MLEVPVYVITGFLESGKTTFIREVLASPDFADGEKTILICCEEGEEEYDLRDLNRHNIMVEMVEDEQEREAMRRPRRQKPDRGSSRSGPKAPRKENSGKKSASGENGSTEEGKKAQNGNRPAQPRNNQGRAPRDQKFGQPVRRENPDREKKSNAYFDTWYFSRQSD